MNHLELRQKFIQFFTSRGHSQVASSSLLPLEDSSVLLTTAGMQQFKPYFAGKPNPYNDKAVSIQKCFRTADIDETGDETHLTFFEMLGNFAFNGQVNKKEAIYWAWEFLTSSAGVSISPDRLTATYYHGGKKDQDNEAKNILESLLNEGGISSISSGGDEDNFWGPTGNEGPCGPTVEFYIDGIEVWNVVFNEFYYRPDGTFSLASGGLGIDTGMGFERLSMAVNKTSSVYETDLFEATRSYISVLPPRSGRIVADHARASVFLLADHITPSNKEQGYILRRVLRRLLIHIQNSGIQLEDLLGAVIDHFASIYPELANQREEILSLARAEADKFSRTLDAGTRELDKLIATGISILDGQTAFNLFSTLGLPIDYMKEKIEVDVAGFETAFAGHQELSRSGAEQKFGGHGLSTGATVSPEDRAKITALHTSTHLLHAALHHLLGSEVAQAGSDITPERTRFDFTYPRKLTDEEKTAIEDWVNQKITTGFLVKKETLPYEQAIASGAMAFFKEKYPPVVDVYTI